MSNTENNAKETKQSKQTEAKEAKQAKQTEAKEAKQAKQTEEAEAAAQAIIADAEAKAAKILADAEAKAKDTQSAPTEEAAKVDPMEELVDYTAPLHPNLKKRDILVGVNGETLRIKRGVPVKIKRKFYEALQNAAQQEFAALETREELQKQSERALASM